MKLVAILFLTALASVACFAQRPRAVDTATDASKATPAPPPQSMKAKYEGGVFGHSHTMDGTLSFDDTNSRLLFRKDGQEVLFIPYNAVNSAFADTQKKQTGCRNSREQRSLSGISPRLDQDQGALPDNSVQRSRHAGERHYQLSFGKPEHSRLGFVCVGAKIRSGAARQRLREEERQ